MMTRHKERKKEQLKSIVSQLICDNPIIVAIVKDASSEFHRKFTVQIKEDCNSWGSKDNIHIILGIGNLEKLFQMCKSFSQAYHLQYSSGNRIFTLKTDGDLNIETNDVTESFWDKVEFFNENTDSAAVTLTKNALAFVLYHEFGHVKYDDDSMLPIEKERKADLFAMDVVKEMCSNSIHLDQNPFFLGAFLENILIMSMSDPKEADISFSHPHPIERIIIFLEYFHIRESSYLWKYTYDELVKWINANNMSMIYERDSSITIKDKLMDAFCRFKK